VGVWKPKALLYTHVITALDQVSLGFLATKSCVAFHSIVSAVFIDVIVQVLRNRKQENMGFWGSAAACCKNRATNDVISPLSLKMDISAHTLTANVQSGCFCYLSFRITRSSILSLWGASSCVIVRSYHTLQMNLQSQLRLLLLYFRLFTTCFGPENGP
jgi:hypothetical protein